MFSIALGSYAQYLMQRKQAALTGNLDLSWEYDELASLSSVVRNDALRGELHRRVRGLESVPVEHMDGAVLNLLTLPLADIVLGLHDPDIFSAQVKSACDQAERINDEAKSNPLIDMSSLSINGSFTANGVHSRSPPSISPPPAPPTPSSEQDRLIIAVDKLGSEGGRVTEIVDLLMSLSKKERAMCLFNQEYLKSKVADAREVLSADDEPARNQSAPAATARPKASPISVDDEPKASSAPVLAQFTSSPSQATSGDLATTASNVPQYTLMTLAALPAKDIIHELFDVHAVVTDFKLNTPNPTIIKANNDFIDSIESKPVQQRKQMLGEKL